MSSQPVEEPIWLRSPPPRRRSILPWILLALAVGTTTVAGFFFHIAFVSNSDTEQAQWIARVLANPLLLWHGLPFSMTLLTILLAHEMGHYVACRWHDIDCTPPFVIPAPPIIPLPGFVIPFNPFGTFGAVIRIRSPFLNRNQLFDVGIAGPLAGFVFIIPAVIAGVMLSRDFVWTGDSSGIMVWGEPLLFKAAVALFYSGSDASSIALHPIGYAAWFGMLATGINLLPIGQLDGGHVVYALWGEFRHRRVSQLAFASLIGVSFLSWPVFGYLFFAIVLVLIGFKHPSPYFPETYVSPRRRAVAWLGVAVFILTFIPVPLRLLES